MEASNKLMQDIERVTLSIVAQLCGMPAGVVSEDDETSDDVGRSNAEMEQRLRTAKSNAIDIRSAAAMPRVTRATNMMALVHTLQRESRNCTLRESFYNALDIYTTQAQLTGTVTDICDLLGVDRYALNVLATEKGCVAGDLHLGDGPESSMLDDLGPWVLISEKLVASTLTPGEGVRCILVVESEAIFQYMLERGVCERHGVILMTGGGYPDFTSRRFLAKLSRETNLPALYMGDWDPHGFGIFITYTTENVYCGKGAYCGNLKWIGLCHADVLTLDRRVLSELDPASKNGTATLIATANKCGFTDVARELKLMEKAKVTCEIEGLHSVDPGYLATTFLASKLAEYTTS